jgi:GTP pyrophosphokinase
MKEYSDVWIAAHFEYKEKWSKIATDISWVSELKDLIDNIWDSDFTHSLKIDIFKDRIYVFTPNWDFINLPSGSTSIDFAYYVHSDLWDHISLSKVNNNIYPLDKELNNWDVIEIVINKNKKPNPLWLGFVKTLKAKNRIKAFIKTENKEKHFERWKDMVNNFFIKRGLDVLDKELSVLRDIDWTHNDKAKRIAILEQVWNLSIKPGSIFKWLKKKEIKSIQSNETSEIKQKNKLSEYNNIVIWWEKKLDYILWDCCKKQFYKKIVAHINNKGVLTIHKRSCDILKKVNKNKLLSAYITGVSDWYIWSELELIIKNDKWILRDLSDIIFSMWINIEWIHTKKLTKNKTQINLNLELMDYDYLLIDRLIDRLCIRFDKGLYEIKIL